MNATGILFLAKTKPLATRTASGEFQLQLLAFDVIAYLQMGNDKSVRITEPYRITWMGPNAEGFWKRHGQQMQPGQPIRVCLERMRSHTTPRGPEIHAIATAMGLAPRANHTQTEASEA